MLKRNFYGSINPQKVYNGNINDEKINRTHNINNIEAIANKAVMHDENSDLLKNKSREVCNYFHVAFYPIDDS